jgi:hypothetical protein
VKHLGGFEAEGFNPVEDALARTEQDRCDVEGDLVDHANLPATKCSGVAGPYTS